MKNIELLYFITALILLTIVGINIYWWVSIASNSSKTFNEVQAEYYQKFPTPFRNGRLITLINIGLLAIATFLFYQTVSNVQLKKWSFILMIICWTLMAWQIFSLL